MKKLLIIPLLLLTLTISATKYYCTPRGSDSNNGADTTSAHAWLTWQYAMTHTPSSDTCYFRGGIYTGMYSSITAVYLYNAGNNGTTANPTRFMAYPSDWIVGNYPILDCSTLNNGETRGTIAGIYIGRYTAHLYFKGLHVRNVLEDGTTGDACYGIYLFPGYDPIEPAVNDITFNLCNVYLTSGHGWHLSQNIDTVYWYNCDSWSNCDSLTNYDPGGWGTGFSLNSSSTDSYLSLKDCRAWKCSDQGYASNSAGVIIYDGCWAVYNGYYDPIGDAQSGGSGWKWATATEKNVNVLQRVLKNCIAVDNQYYGFTANDWSTVKPLIRSHIYNNFSYRNGHLRLNGQSAGWGFVDGSNTDTTGLYDYWYRNNLSYDNYGDVNGLQPGDLFAGYYHAENNYWDVVGSTVTAADFVSLDTTGLCGPRQVDGSLPITQFGHLAPTSELINAGTTNTGLPYSGNAPDIGWAEYIGEKILTKPGYIIFKNNKIVTHIER